MTTITTNGFTLLADVCLRCGARIYPATAMVAHLARHVILEAECIGRSPWAWHREPKTHVPNRMGRPRKKDSEKASTAIIKHHNRGER